MSRTATIVEGAFDELGLTNEFQNASPTQTTQAMDRLQAVVNSAYGFDIGEMLTDWPIGEVGVNALDLIGLTPLEWCYPPQNVRMIVNVTTPQTVYMPPDPEDGSRISIADPASRLGAANITIDGNGRMVEGAQTKVMNTNGATRIWFYRADLGSWVVVSPLLITDDFPFPPEFDDYFITMLAVRIEPRYGRAMTELSTTTLQRSQTQLIARYRNHQAAGVPTALMKLTHTYNDQRGVVGNSQPVHGDLGFRGRRGRYGWMS